MKIALIDSFFSGSHKQWGLDLKQYSNHQIHFYSMKGIHWKWRMHGGAITLSKQLNESQFNPDLILITDMIDVAVFKSLLKNELQNIPIILYFHENQLMYPKSKLDMDSQKMRDNHYGFINFTSALVADKIIFNSLFHQNEFIKELNTLLKKFPDYSVIEHVAKIQNKTTVLPIGIKHNIKGKNKHDNSPPVILWNHRWEHDKNPEQFFNILFKLKNDNIKFKLNVIGENFKSSPKIFLKAKSKLTEEILNWGYVKSRDNYFNILKESDILPVTSNHDFFGISTVEAIFHGVHPILPNRLAYPEHIPLELNKECIYHSENDLFEKIKIILMNGIPNSNQKLQNHIQKYEMNKVIQMYDDYFDVFI